MDTVWALDISSCDRVMVLKLLYDYATAHLLRHNMGLMAFATNLGRTDLPRMSYSVAQELLDRHKISAERFDYVEGRALKVDLRGSRLDCRLYDREYGTGSACRALSDLHLWNVPNEDRPKETYRKVFQEAPGVDIVDDICVVRTDVFYTLRTEVRIDMRCGDCITAWWEWHHEDDPEHGGRACPRCVKP
jgi:hypothetical protein